jgi:hypothetical protein
MYRAGITPHGEAWLGKGGCTPTHQALAALISPQLEAANPRALFDAFCARLTERLAAPPSIDECRGLWRTLRREGLIAVRGSLQIDGGRAFALTEPLAQGGRPRWDGTRDGAMLALRDAAAPTMVEVPLIPRRVSNFFRTTLTRLLRVARGK